MFTPQIEQTITTGKTYDELNAWAGGRFMPDLAVAQVRGAAMAAQRVGRAQDHKRLVAACREVAAMLAREAA